jgi:hypothetical protein
MVSLVSLLGELAIDLIIKVEKKIKWVNRISPRCRLLASGVRFFKKDLEILGLLGRVAMEVHDHTLEGYLCSLNVRL